nr:MAG TPA: hypothetical protein [Caudoviricetes sp.]
MQMYKIFFNLTTLLQLFCKLFSFQSQPSSFKKFSTF